MHIDFHHTVTYVTARLAGFNHQEGETIAYCAQYVDDATNDGTILFNNGAMYKRIASAHKMMDYRNIKALANHQVWMPFHFLPGNGGKKAGKDPSARFIDKIVCKPNSFVAKDMLKACIEDRHKIYGLHRLGVTMHVYADTWAHQGFAGVNHKINQVTKLDDEDEPDLSFFGKIKNYFGDEFDEKAGEFIGGAFPLGHGAALSYPDLPFLNWSYQNGHGEKVVRKNTQGFVAAADHLCQAMQKYRQGDFAYVAPGLPAKDKKLIRKMFKELTDTDGEVRHKQWLLAIAEGRFSFPGEQLSYIAKGKGSWKHTAIRTTRKKDKKKEVFPYDPGFLESDWKKFHDAVQAHRFDVIHDILPRYGICAA